MNNLPNQNPGQPGPGGFPPPSNQGGQNKPTPPRPPMPLKSPMSPKTSMPPRPPMPQNSADPLMRPPMPPKPPATQQRPSMPSPRPIMSTQNRSASPIAPPPPEITLRTMQSDTESIKQSGGSTPTPKPFTPEQFKKPLAPRPPAPSKITPSEFGASKLQGAQSIESSSIIEEDVESKFNFKRISVWVGTLVIAVGFGLLGYFVIFPALFPSQLPPEPILNTPTTPETPVVPEVPSAPEIPEATPIIHNSFLNSDSSTTLQLVAVDLLTLTNNLQQEAQKGSLNGSLVEVIINDSNGQVASPRILSSILPEFSKETLSQTFTDDFTAALYYDANGTWPVYVFDLSLETNILEAQANMSEIENSNNLSNFFLGSPGSPTGVFKDGQANGTLTRYQTYSNTGAALNYGWEGNKFIVSTSYSGMKKALENLK
ncbi:hypothetical protein GW950_00485 [Candidatus Wolfebacteria bacterium]|nr:hypothetical protein [Candidatus Wolfebacteria bacterium]